MFALVALPDRTILAGRGIWANANVARRFVQTLM